MENYILILIGIVGGVASGLLGIGGAILMIPALVFILGFSQQTAQGTTLCAMVPPIGLLAAWQYYKAGHADLKAAIIIAITFFIGAFFGSKASMAINPQILKKSFGFLLLYISVKMITGK